MKTNEAAKLQKACIVISKSGHDKDDVFVVVGFENGRVLIADGDKRKLANPKTKNPAHLIFRGDIAVSLVEKLNDGTAMDSDIKKAMSEYRRTKECAV